MSTPTLTLSNDQYITFAHPFPFKRSGFGPIENLTVSLQKELQLANNYFQQSHITHTPITLGIVSNKLDQLVPVIRDYASHFDQLVINWTDGNRYNTLSLEQTLDGIESRFEHLRGNITLQKSNGFNNDFARTRESINDASKYKWVFHLDDDEQIPRAILANMQSVLEFMDYSKRTMVGIPRVTYLDGVRVTPQTDQDWQYRIVTQTERYQHPVHAQPKSLFGGSKNKLLVMLLGAPLTHRKTIDQHNDSQDLYKSILPGSEGPKIPKEEYSFAK